MQPLDTRVLSALQGAMRSPGVDLEALEDGVEVRARRAR
jgi:hypothetical protein